LFLGNLPIRKRGFVSDDELLAATVTAQDPHFLEPRGFLSALTFLYRHCTHLLNISD
jgi:hypothetical protein